MADEDIFMDYAESSPMEDSQSVGKGINVNYFNFQSYSSSKSQKTIQELLSEKENILKSLLNNDETHSNRLKVVQLRQFNRSLASEIIEKRRKLSKLKDFIDDLNGKLLCQQFEKQHLLNEIRMCLSSKNIYESIQLESDPIHGECDSNNVPSATSHELMKRKLQWELAKRKELQTKLISVLQKKKEFEIGLEGKRRKIDELRSHLQTFLKNSKPLLDVCEYDFVRKNIMEKEHEMVVDNNENNDLMEIYDKLVNFVEGKSEYKVKYFKVENEQQEHEDKIIDTIDQNYDRDAPIKSDYIQVKIQYENTNNEVEEEEIDIIFIKSENGNLELKIQNELISNWIEEIEILDQNLPEFKCAISSSSESLIYSSLILLQNSEAFTRIFGTIKDAIQLRNQMQNILQDSGVEFDKNELTFKSDLCVLKAKISIKSIIWSCENDFDLERASLLVEELNSITATASILDCLKSQLELLNRGR